ncbi:N-acetylglucosaminyl deacetylase, LmbE family [Granulicella pectinivorans]|uniref:N-acetylglucosaminyl deacetylase, LmbE family n=1 Tax=Granulicella pectinivorans TaxID=474950 RepID=A0A1I6MYC4_9BACT|nr:PIG-L family deacetylase [Granulicella pectinivorans]SFS20693.1 N-acetylglucosaminyl deacetylase, LmbE family [Granulicella pectinivorans]
MAPQSSYALLSRRSLAVASSLLLAAVAFAQKPAPTPDPANLAGEQVSAPALADTLPINHGAPALAQLLKKLRTRASLMMIVAHPDDEDGGMLTYESRGQGVRTAMLTLTRGEGGQNLMTADFNDALGLIRTQELLAADRYMGVDQFFGSVVDFGFSKTPEETLAQWTHKRVLYDTVRAVRLYRPLVLTSTWIGGVTDGHGHHQVSGQMNQEVFTAAADPNVFPEMGLPPWAPLKVYARQPFARIGPEGMFDYATGKSTPARFYNYVTKQWTATPPAANVLIPEGTPSSDPGMDGDTYLQFARKGLALQKTQNGGATRQPRATAYDAPYTRYGSRVPAKDKEQSFFEGIDISLPGIATLAPDAPASLRTTLQSIDAKIAEAQKLFSVEHPETTAAPLREALKTLDTLLVATDSGTLADDQKFNVLHELRIKRVQLNNALLLAHGITLTATLDQPEAGQHLLSTQKNIFYKVKLSNDGPDPIELDNTHVSVLTGTIESTLKPHTSPEALREIQIAQVLPPTRPYFTRPGIEQPFYDIADPALRDAPATPLPLVTSQPFNDQGVPLEIKAIVGYASGPEQGQPVVIVPPVSVALNHAAGIVSPAERSFPLITHTTVQIDDSLTATHRPPAAPQSAAATAVLRLTDKAPILIHPALVNLAATHAGPAVESTFTVTPKTIVAGSIVHLSASVTYEGREYAEGFRPVGYSTLPATNQYTPATYKATAVDVVTAPHLKIAYLPGTGDDVAAYLPNLGVKPTILSVTDLANLSQYDAVLLGVRAYAAHPELSNSKALLDYAKAGGVVIVQYNTARYGSDQSPYPIEVPGDSAHNVVVEAQPVQILAPNAPLMSWPNKLTADDFKGWNEELGHGFASSWDNHFDALTETHDPDQDPQKGGLLYARTGRGAYVYLAYALYRQLPEGVPGAYRLLANLISLPKNPASGIQPVAR